MNKYDLNADGFRKFVEAYIAGVPRDKLAEMAGLSVANVSGMTAALCRFGVMQRRKNVIGAETRAAASARMKNFHADAAAFRASRIAAE